MGTVAWEMGILVVWLVLPFIAFVVFLKQPTLRCWPHREGLRADPERLERDVTFLAVSAFPRSVAHPEQLDKAADYVRASFEAAGAEVQDERYRAGDLPCRNVTARLGPRDGVPLVVGAHYDVFGDLPGADDNASGVAGLLELARLLQRHPPPIPLLLVAYSTEEPPFFASAGMGSWVHASGLREEGAAIRGMIALEMIGCFTENQPRPNLLLRLFYPRTGDFIAVVGRWGDYRLVRHLKKGFAPGGGVDVQGYAGPRIMGMDLSDHSSYWAHGYRAVMVTDTAFIRNPRYHTRHDTPDTLDYARMASVVEGLARAILAADRL